MVASFEELMAAVQSGEAVYAKVDDFKSVAALDQAVKAAAEKGACFHLADVGEVAPQVSHALAGLEANRVGAILGAREDHEREVAARYRKLYQSELERVKAYAEAQVDKLKAALLPTPEEPRRARA
jgi:hypothetical protein